MLCSPKLSFWNVFIIDGMKYSIEELRNSDHYQILHFDYHLVLGLVLLLLACLVRLLCALPALLVPLRFSDKKDDLGIASCDPAWYILDVQVPNAQ
jgi:hypothetical protein